MFTLNFFKKNIIITNLFLIILIFSGCKKKKVILKRVEIKQSICSSDINLEHDQKVANVTIWIHGTRLLPKWMANRYFESDPGLNTAEAVNKKFYMRTVVETISASESKKHPFDDFYVFGWSGDLSFKQREKAAQDLHDSLLKLIEKYKSLNLQPKITIISHSHGGNVALNLVKFLQCDDLEIDNLILLACPVQNETKQFIKHKIFKKIYSFYSSMDVFQILDPQGLHGFNKNQDKDSKCYLPLFSERRFECHEKLCQVKIKINGRGVLHSEFLSQRFLRMIPQIIGAIDSNWQLNSDQSINPEYLLSIKFRE